ncbi:MAG: signal peptidase II [Proteobacteria bacterium]|nr:signal peptidase II [Pseudomonadota bacterium]
MLKKICMKTEKCESKLVGLKWFWFLPVLFLLDQISKGWVVSNLSFSQVLPLCPGLNLTLSHNRGIAFSLLAQNAALGQILLILAICLICLFVAVWLAKTPSNERWMGISLSLILGGALGNLYDRVVHGYVIDFIDFYIQSWHWYTFNLADSFITIGALMSIKFILNKENT